MIDVSELSDKTIVGFTGLKGSGKSTAANRLVDEHGFEKMAFADPLKEAVKDIFHLTDSQVYDSDPKETVDERWEQTPRTIMQKFGTEVGRNIDESVWVKNLLIRLKKSDSDRICIEDCRFPNEAEAIRRAGGKVVGIVRNQSVFWDMQSTPLFDFAEWVGLIDTHHPSEKQMVDNWDSMVDEEILNTFSKELLLNKVDNIYD